MVYHSLISCEQSTRLENLQKMSLRLIYGFGMKYEDLLLRACIPTLKERRESAFLKFARNLTQNSRYDHWLPKNINTEQRLRKTKTYKEFFARTDRL